MTPSPTPRKDDLKRAEEIVDAETSGDPLICGPDGNDVTQEVIAAIAEALSQARQDAARDAATTVYLASKDYASGKGAGCWEELCKDGSCNLCIIKRCEVTAARYQRPDEKT